MQEAISFLQIQDKQHLGPNLLFEKLLVQILALQRDAHFITNNDSKQASFKANKGNKVINIKEDRIGNNKANLEDNKEAEDNIKVK
jgi:hypothetical protein